MGDGAAATTLRVLVATKAKSALLMVMMTPPRIASPYVSQPTVIGAPSTLVCPPPSISFIPTRLTGRQAPVHTR